MRRSLFLLLIFCIMGCTSPCEKLKHDYRYNPFIFPFNEYYYKANIVELKSKINVDSNTTHIQFFDLHATIPGKWSSKETPFSKNRTAYKVRNKENDLNYILITNEKKCLFTEFCKDSTDEKDFCSAFKTPIELYEKLFTLTPDREDLTIGDLWIIHRKGQLFEFVKKIYIYKLDNFIAFREDYDLKKRPKASAIETTISLFPYKNNMGYAYLVISTNFSDDDLILQLLQSITKTSP